MFKALLQLRDGSRGQQIPLQPSAGVRLPVTAERRLPPCGPETLLTASALATSGLRSILMLQATRTVLRLSFSALTALFVTHLLANRVSLHLLGAVVVVLALGSLCGFAADRGAAGLELKVANGLGDNIRKILATMSASDTLAIPLGTLIAGVQRYPQAVARLVVGHRLASTMLALGPLLAAIAIAIVSWEAALALVVLTPVMIIIFAVIGSAIRNRAVAQEKAFGRLAAQFADRIRTLPTILGNHALAREQRKLSMRLNAYSNGTMKVLEIAFLNSAIIDLFSSLSIAVLAVLLSLGQLKLIGVPGFSGLQLWQSLLILMLAPEYFAPFRRYSEQYHAKAEGLAAAAALDRLFDTRQTTSEAVEGASEASFFKIVALPLPRKGLVAITGPSGSGKTTLLRNIADVGLASTIPASPETEMGIAWCSTDIYIREGTLGDVLACGKMPCSRNRLLLVASSLGLLDDQFLPGGLDARISAGGENLSGGQRVRIGLARALLSGLAIFADEPTAKLDSSTAAMVRQVLVDASTSRLVLVATHDRTLAALAERNIDLGRSLTQAEGQAA